MQYKRGLITAYGNAYKDDEFKSPMSPAEIKEIGISGNLVDTFWTYDDEREEEVFELTYNTFDLLNSNSLSKLRRNGILTNNVL